MYNTFMFLRNTHRTFMPYRELFKLPKYAFSKSIIPKGTLLETKKEISVRVMTKDDLRMVMQWAVKEGWNPGKYEVEPLYHADPNGYRLLSVDGEPVASLAGVKHSDNLAFLGLYIVRPEYRGKGYGKLLWDITMGTLKDCRTIGLNGVLDQVENYAKSGFKPATLNTRWKGKPPKELFENKKKSIITTSGNFFSKKIIDYDTEIFTTRRAEFLTKWLTMPESHVMSVIDNGILRGYGVISISEDGYKIAPLFADNEEIAEKICLELCQITGNNAFIHLDTNENNPLAATLAKRFGLEKVFDTLRMYKGETPKFDNKKIFGLTTLEIG